MQEEKYIRILDDTGRLTIPKKIRKDLDITGYNDVVIYVEGTKIVVEKE